jgi:hypothetical protein
MVPYPILSSSLGKSYQERVPWKSALKRAPKLLGIFTPENYIVGTLSRELFNRELLERELFSKFEWLKFEPAGPES